MSLLSTALAFLAVPLMKRSEPVERDTEIAALKEELRVARDARDASFFDCAETAAQLNQVRSERDAWQALAVDYRDRWYATAHPAQTQMLMQQAAGLAAAGLANQAQGGVQWDCYMQQANSQLQSQYLQGLHLERVRNTWPRCDCSPPGRFALLTRGE